MGEQVRRALGGAITDPQQRAIYSFGVQTSSDWTTGSAYTAGVPGMVDISSEVKAQGTTRVTWQIVPVGTSCRLTVIHDDLPDQVNPELHGGWPMILSGLKTLLETGESLDTPGSLMYSR